MFVKHFIMMTVMSVQGDFVYFQFLIMLPSSHTHIHTLITLHVNYYFFLFNVLQKMLMDMKQVREKRKQNQFQGKEYYFD